MPSLLDLCLDVLCYGEIAAIRDSAPESSLQLLLKPSLLETLDDYEPLKVPYLERRVLEKLSANGTLSSRVVTRLLAPPVNRKWLPLNRLSGNLDDLPPLTGLKEIDLSYCPVVSDRTFVNMAASADSLIYLSLNHVPPYFDGRKLTDFKNLQHLDLHNSQLKDDTLNTVLFSLVGLEYLDISSTTVCLYSILLSLSKLVNLRHLAMNRMPILRSTDLTSMNDFVESVGKTFQKLTALQHLDISDMYEDVTSLISGRKVLISILRNLHLEWLDVTGTPGLSLTWLLAKLKKLDFLKKLRFLGFLDAVDFRDVVDSGNVPSQLQIACFAGDRVEPLLQQEYLKRQCIDVCQAIESIIRETPMLDTAAVTRLIKFSIHGLARLPYTGEYSDYLNGLCGLLFMATQRCCPEYGDDYQVFELAVRRLVVACYADQEDNYRQTVLWSLACFIIGNAQFSEGLKTNLVSLLAWTVDRQCQKTQLDILDNRVEVCLHAGEGLLELLDETELAHLGCELRLVDNLLALLHPALARNNFTEHDNCTIGLLRSLTACCSRNRLHLIFPCDGSQRGGAMLLIGIACRFGVYEAVLEVLGNVAEEPKLRWHLCFRDMLQLIDSTLDIEDDDIQCAAAHLLCQLRMCTDERLLTEETHLGINDLLKKMAKLFTSISVGQLKQVQVGRDPFQRSLLEMVVYSCAPEVVHFGLLRIASLCCNYPSMYCPVLLDDDGLSVIEAVEFKVCGDNYLTQRIRELISAISSAVTQYTAGASMSQE